MHKLTLFASALTISAVAFAGTASAQGGCAAEIEALKAQQLDATDATSTAGGNGEAGASGSMAGNASPGGSSMSASEGPGNNESTSGATAGETSGSQTVAEGTTQTFTSEDSASAEDGDDETSGGTSGATSAAEASDTPSGAEEDTGADEIARNDSTGDGEGPAEGTTNMQDVEAPAISNNADTSAAPMPEGTRASASDDGGASMSGDTASSPANSPADGEKITQTMSSTHLAAAQMALNSGDEKACMAAVEAAKQAM